MSVKEGRTLGQPPIILIGPEEPGREREAEARAAPRLDYRLVAGYSMGTLQQWVPSPAGLRGPRPVRLSRSLVGNLGRAIRLVGSLGPGSTVYSTGETWGLPVAVVGGQLRRRFVHVVYAHRVYSPLWQRLLRHLCWRLHVTGWICVNSHQAGMLRSALGDRAHRVTVVSPGVDTLFYDPARARPARHAPCILSVGAEMRNFPLLLAAARRLEAPVVLKASSAWMGQLRESPDAMPPNVRLLQQHLPYVELRDLYAAAALVVVPLYDTSQAAGITTILEGMAMGKPVVVTRSRGLPDGLVSGKNCIIVEPDPTRLAEAITALLVDPAQMEAIAFNGRRFVVRNHSLEHHAEQITGFLHAVAEEP